MTSEKTERSSARSICTGLVPRMFTPRMCRGSARLFGIWPPTEMMAPEHFYNISSPHVRKQKRNQVGIFHSSTTSQIGDWADERLQNPSREGTQDRQTHTQHGCSLKTCSHPGLRRCVCCVRCIFWGQTPPPHPPPHKPWTVSGLSDPKKSQFENDRKRKFREAVSTR